MLDLLNGLTEVLRGMLDSPWLWLIVFVLSTLDALLPFMPSEGAVMAVAVLLGDDLPSLGLLLVVAILGALAGDYAAYWIGRSAGERALRRFVRDEQRKRQLAWVRHRVYRHTPVLAIVARYIPGGRVATALACGSLRYPVGRFVFFDGIGVTIWAVYAVGVGHFGSSQFAGEPLKALLLAFGTGLVVAGIGEVVRRATSRTRTRRDPEDTPENDAENDPEPSVSPGQS